MRIFKGDEADDDSSGSTLGTPGGAPAEAPPGTGDDFVVSGGGVADPTDDGPGSAGQPL